MMDDEAALRESVSNLRDAVLLGRSDIIRSILSTAAEFREEGELFGDEEDNDPLARQRYFEEYTDPYDILKLILNYVDNDSGTCLHLATKMKYGDGVRTLLSAGADPTIANKEGATAFDYCTDNDILGIYNEELLQAAAGANIPRVTRLLKAGISANASDGAASDNKVLHWAASFGNPEVVTLLCDNNADVNCVNSTGATPLHDAVNRGDVEIVQVLLEYGADPGMVIKSGHLKGKNAVDLAVDFEIKQVLTTCRDDSSATNPPALQNGEVHDRDILDADSDSADTISQLSSPLPRIKQIAVSPSSPLSMDPLFYQLWPIPQRIQEISGSRFIPPATLPIHIHQPSDGSLAELCNIWEILSQKFELAGYPLDMRILAEGNEDYEFATGSIECQVCPNLFNRPESYRIHITAQKLSIIASEAVSLWYAANTALQLLRVFHRDKGIPQAQISDWPDIKYRGVLIDVSTGRVPKMDTLLFLIDILATVKVNQLQLYMQNTFAFQGHENVSRNTTPYTQSDIIKLDRYCRDRYIELVPHIESLSGFSRWFVYKQYAHLAERNEDSNDSAERPPMCLCPTSDESLALARGLHSQAFPCFSSRRFAHAGIDVTEEFGRGKSYVIAQAKGKEEVYMSYLRTMHRSCRRHGRTMQFWANPLHEHPDRLHDLPSDVIAMEYGDKANYDFMKHCRLLSDAGVSFFVCPGTLTWNSACANTDDSLTIINNAVQTAVACDALGILACDWSLPGHVNPLCMSVPAFLMVAGMSWKADTDMTLVQSSLPSIVSTHAFLDSSGKLGRALCDLGRVHSMLLKSEPEKPEDQGSDSCVHPLAKPREGTVLWKILSRGGEADLQNMTIDSIQQAARHIRQCQNTFTSADMKCPLGGDFIKELDTTVDILLFVCRMCRALLLAKNQNSEVNTLQDLPPINRTDLANRLLGLIEHYQKVYLLRNKQGGLLTAKQQLEKILQRLLPQQTNTTSQN